MLRACGAWGCVISAFWFGLREFQIWVGVVLLGILLYLSYLFEVGRLFQFWTFGCVCVPETHLLFYGGVAALWHVL